MYYKHELATGKNPDESKGKAQEVVEKYARLGWGVHKFTMDDSPDRAKISIWFETADQYPRYPVL